MAANTQRVETPLALFHCPTRRKTQLYPVNPSSDLDMAFIYCSLVTTVSRMDYAACIGDADESDTAIWSPYYFTSYAQGDAENWDQLNAPYGFDGVCYRASQVKACDVTDGLSDTYMLGEKYLNPDEYLTGTNWGDDQNAYLGWSNNNHRTAKVIFGGLSYPPTQDTPGDPNDIIFGRLTAWASTWPSATGRST